jgi:hypothetical protein
MNGFCALLIYDRFRLIPTVLPLTFKDTRFIFDPTLQEERNISAVHTPEKVDEGGK